MITTRVYYANNAVYIDGLDLPIVAGTLTATLSGDQILVTADSRSYPLTALPWEGVAAQDGTTFPSSDAVMTYLAAQFAMRRVVGSPQRNYALPISDMQTIFPISPSPLDVNTVVLVVNGVDYAPPDIAVSALTVTWQGPFSLASTDIVRVTYF